jgi:hypothetical protein
MIRKWLAARRLAKSLKPNPNLRTRRLAQMSPERRARAERNAAEIAELIGGVR